MSSSVIARSQIFSSCRLQWWESPGYLSEGPLKQLLSVRNVDGGSMECRLSSSCIMTTLGEQSALWNRRQHMLTGTMCITILARCAGMPPFSRPSLYTCLRSSCVQRLGAEHLRTLLPSLHLQTLRGQQTSTDCMAVQDADLLIEQHMSDSLEWQCRLACAPCQHSSALPESSHPHIEALQVFRHRTYGYRGVIYGWDRSCDRDLSWTEKLNVDANQPFYWVLPDEVDCQRLFGGVRISKYVAQVQLLHWPQAPPDISAGNF